MTKPESVNVRLLAAYQLGHRDADESVRAALHASRPELAGWHNAARYLRDRGAEQWSALHPEDVMSAGYLDPSRDLLPEEAAADLLMEEYWRSVARLAGWTEDAPPSGSEILDLIRTLEH